MTPNSLTEEIKVTTEWLLKEIHKNRSSKNQIAILLHSATLRMNDLLSEWEVKGKVKGRGI